MAQTTLALGYNGAGAVNNTVTLGAATGGTTNVTVGNTHAGTTTIQGGTGVVIGVNGATNTATTVYGTALIKTGTNSTTGFQVQNSSGSALVTQDTTNMRVGIDNSYTAMSTPATPTSPAQASSGGSLTCGATYRYKTTAIDSAGGESAASAELSQATPACGTNVDTITLSTGAVTGASGYRIYRTAANGASGSEVYLTTILNAGAGAFVDTGSIAAGAASAPGTNSAYTSTNTSNGRLQLSVGGLGTPTGQLYVSGVTPKDLTNGGVATSGYGSVVSVQGRYAYSLNYGGFKLQVFDASNPASPVDVSNGGVSIASPISLYVQGRYAYVTYYGGGLNIYDISNPSTPVLVGNVSAGLQEPFVYVQGRYAYIVSQLTNKFQVFDVSNPASPVDITAGGVATGSGPDAIFVQGRYAYVLDSSSSKLQVFDVSNPASPVDVSSGGIATGSTPNDLYVEGRYAYVGDYGAFKLQIFDVSNPAVPSDVSNGGVSTTARPSAGGLQVQGRYAYLAEGSALQVFDVSNPTSPVDASSGGVSVSADTVYVQGRYAYVVGNTFMVFDLGGAYLQQLQAGGLETGTLQTDGNATFNGDITTTGGLTIGTSLQVSGTAAVNATGTVDGLDLNLSNTSGTEANGLLINRNGAGGTTTNGLQIASAAGTLTNGVLFSGTIGTDIATAAATNLTVVSGTTGTATLDTGTTGTVNIGTGSSAKTIAIGTGAADTINIGNGAFAETVNIGSTNTTSTTSINAGSGGVVIGTSGNTVTFSGSTGEPILAGTARHAKSKILPAEYEGAVLDATNDATCSSANAGTMTSGNDLTNRQNYYNWTSTNASTQCYNVVIQVPVPADFSTWATTGNVVTVETYTDSTSNGGLNLEVRDTGGTVEGSYNFVSITPGSASTWTAYNIAAGGLAGTYSANGVLTLRIRMSSKSSANVRIGTITLNYLSKF